MELYLRFALAMTFLVSISFLIAYKDSIRTGLASWFSSLSVGQSTTTKKKTTQKKFYFFPLVIISAGASVSVMLFFFLKSIMSSITFGRKESIPSPTTPSITEIAKDIPWWIPENKWYFVGILGISLFVIAVWRFVTSDKKNGKKGEFPPKEILTLLVGIPAVHWLTWSIFPNFWVSWLSSELFFPMHIAMFITAWLAEKKSKGTLYKVTVGLIAVSALLAVKKTASAQGFSTTISSWWKPKTSAVPLRIPTVNRERNKLPSSPFVFYHGPQKQAVIDAFPDDTTMWNIAACESQFHQFRENGELVVNPNSSATGVFQIMRSVHEKEALSRSLDITTLEGNIAYAKYLREKKGYRDWEASSFCWRDGYSEESFSGETQESPRSSPTASILPAIDPSRVVAESLVVVLPDGEFTNKFYPGRYAMVFRVENPRDSVYALAEEVGSSQTHDAILTYDGTRQWNFMVKSISFRALNPSDTIRVWVRWQFKR